MVEISRTPLSAMYSVRGMGVAVRVSTSTSVRIFFSAFFVGHPKALFFIDDQQAQVFEVHIIGQQAVRADRRYPSRHLRQALEDTRCCSAGCGSARASPP